MVSNTPFFFFFGLNSGVWCAQAETYLNYPVAQKCDLALANIPSDTPALESNVVPHVDHASRARWQKTSANDATEARDIRRHLNEAAGLGHAERIQQSRFFAPYPLRQVKNDFAVFWQWLLICLTTSLRTIKIRLLLGRKPGRS